MQMVKKIVVMILLIWFVLLVLMPKEELYFKLEKELAQQGVKINEKSIDEGIFSLTLNEADVYGKGIKLATIEKATFFTLLFYTKVELDSVKMDSSLQNMMPTQIDEVTLTHGIWDPMHVSVQAGGSFGGTEGTIALAERTLRLDFNATQGIEMLKSQLKQDEKGWYYETSF